MAPRLCVTGTQEKSIIAFRPESCSRWFWSVPALIGCTRQLKRIHGQGFFYLAPSPHATLLRIPGPHHPLKRTRDKIALPAHQ